MSTYASLQAEAMKVFGDKNKPVSTTAIRLLERVFRGEQFPTEANINSARKAENALLVLLDDVRTAQPAKMNVTLEGERYLSDETLKNKASGYVLKTRDIARLKRDTERRIAELESMLKSIEAKIPHAQQDDFRKVLSEVAESFQNVPL